MANPLEFVPLETYVTNLGEKFNSVNQAKIQKGLERLDYNPLHGDMMQGPIIIAGKPVYGLRHIKIGVQGSKGGAFILYRYCKECFNNGYAVKSKITCLFCDPSKPNRIILFDVGLRGEGYKNK